MSNLIYFCLFAINICKTHYPFDISVRIAQTLFSEKCLPFFWVPVITSFEEDYLSPSEILSILNCLLLIFVAIVIFSYLLREGNNANLRYRKIQISQKNIVIEKQVAIWSDSLLFCEFCGHCLAPSPLSGAFPDHKLHLKFLCLVCLLYTFSKIIKMNEAFLLIACWFVCNPH